MTVARDQVDILLVEDSPHDAEMTIRTLKRNNLAGQLHHVKDGIEALDFLFAEGSYLGRNVESAPRVVLLDLKLPRLDGLEVLRKLKSDPRTRAIPVVVMTSSAEESDVVESYRLGVNGYVVKPVAFDAFVEAVSRLGLYWLVVNHPPH